MNVVTYYHEQMERVLEKRGFIWGLVKCYELSVYDENKGRFVAQGGVHLYKKEFDFNHLWTTIYKYALHETIHQNDCFIIYCGYRVPKAHRYMFLVPPDIMEEVEKEIGMKNAGISQMWKVSPAGELVELTINHGENGGMPITKIIAESDPLHPEIIKLMNIYS